MPQVFKVGPYLVFFWLNESEPLEPIHVHISRGKPERNATKVWLTKAGGCLLEHNGSHIPDHVLRNIMEIIATRHLFVELRWRSKFGEVKYYC